MNINNEKWLFGLFLNFYKCLKENNEIEVNNLHRLMKQYDLVYFKSNNLQRILNLSKLDDKKVHHALSLFEELRIEMIEKISHTLLEKIGRINNRCVLFSEKEE